ncbi:MAG TPA: 23S rRNA (uracil(1939)-C(5))-methyltransferase RlmD [Xanthomonadaceae bacterium]|nr:23S rRNA (uracil(1939)-C(5))-methyltransferase RlmD [Xanthomonadaceae bacterium]
MSREFEAAIVDLSHDGRGVARREGKTVFVSGALPGERVRARQTGRRRSFDEAVTLEVLERAPDRVEPRCPHFGQCGGCTLQHMDAQRQIQAKQRVLVENLARIGHVEAASVLAPLTAEPWGYRRKARLGVKWVEKKGRAVVGFREAGNPRFIADLSRCEVLVPAVGERIAAISALLTSLDARAQLPQIEVAAGDDTVALVFRHLQPISDGDRRKLVDFGRTHGFAIFLQPGGVDSVHALWPESPTLEFSIAGHELRLAFLPLDFVQVNTSMNHRMVDHALALLDPQPTDRVLDLFCGLGNFTLPIARRAGAVVGVEGEAGLVQRARDNAVANGIGNARFHVADLCVDLHGEPWYGQGFDRILLDPPRSGAEAVVRSLPLEAARRIVYVSCHPGSLARDAGILVHERGFVLRAAGVMDMFPHTAHVESIAMFERS